MRFLVIAAHPDDEVLGCGGTIARLAQEGQEVHIAILGEGITSRHAQREDADRRQVKALQDCSRRAAALLGAREPLLSGLPDNRFDSVPLLDIVKVIEGHVDRLRPDVIYTHHGGDLNIDHAITHRATLTATRPMAGTPVRALYAFEVPSSTEWAFGQLGPAFQAQRFVDISRTLEIKIQALQLYEGEARPYPHPRSPEALRAIAQRWGSHVGRPAAEAFSVVREIE